MRNTFLARISSGLFFGALLSGCNSGGSSTSNDNGSSGTVDPVSTTDTTMDAISDPTTDATTDDPTTDEPTTSGGPVSVAKRVFVTSASFHGDLRKQGAGADGIEGADLLCAAAAASSGLGGTWIAWVSSSSVDVLSRLPADAHWTLIDETTEVFPSRSQIHLGPKHAIDMTEAGDTLAPIDAEFPTVWTNTSSFGTFSDDGQNDACDDWTGQTGIAAVGVLFDPELGGGAGLHWTDTKQPRACGGEYHLYCFEN